MTGVQPVVELKIPLSLSLEFYQYRDIDCKILKCMVMNKHMYLLLNEMCTLVATHTHMYIANT